MAFEIRQKIRFGDVDRAGIAFYPRILHMCHVAFERLWDEFFKRPFSDVMDKEGFGMPVVNIQADFKKALKFGEEIIFSVSLFQMGNKSVTLLYSLLDSQTRDLKAKISVTTVATNIKDFKSMRIPQKYRRLFEKINN